VTVRTSELRTDESSANLYRDGAVANIADFYNCVTKGDHSNPTVAPSVRSNLMTVLGRTAAYEHGLVTWKEMLRRKEEFKADLRGLKA
jgi:myo-inositol 2-dehydrogenase / D-chiro-inositol 1-dehydrogenase